MDVPSTILRALDNMEGDVDAGVIDANADDIRKARAWTRQLWFEWNQANGNLARLSKPTGLPFIVGHSQVKPGEQFPTLGAFASEGLAAQFIETLPDHESGRYWLEGPSDDYPEDSHAAAATLEERVATAHAVPHAHEIDGQPLGHQRMAAMSVAGILPEGIMCGLLEEHPAHPWVELRQEFQCPGRGWGSNPLDVPPEVITVLDNLAETFMVHGEEVARHHIRAVAHNMGWHLTGCEGGLRRAPEGPNW